MRCIPKLHAEVKGIEPMGQDVWSSSNAAVVWPSSGMNVHKDSASKTRADFCLAKQLPYSLDWLINSVVRRDVVLRQPRRRLQNFKWYIDIYTPVYTCRTYDDVDRVWIPRESYEHCGILKLENLFEAAATTVTTTGQYDVCVSNISRFLGIMRSNTWGLNSHLPNTFCIH